MASGKTFNLKAILSATDSISPALKSVDQKIGKVGRSLSSLGQVSAGIASKLAMPMGALSGLSGFSLSGVVSKFTSLGDSIDKASKRAGVATGALQQLRYAARLGGMSTEQMDQALAKLTNNMGQAISGKNADLADMFSKLGISLKNSDGSARSAASVMRDLAEAVKTNADPAVRLRMLTAAFGDDLASKLVPVLQDGAEGLDAAAQKARDLGIVLSHDMVNKAAHLSDVFEDFRSVLDSAASSIGAALAPAIEAVVGKVQKWIAANKDLLAQRLASIFDKVAAAIDSINIDSVINGFVSFVDTIATVIDSVGGVTTILKALGLMIGVSLIGDLVSLVSTLKSVGMAFVGAFGPVGVVIAAVVAAGVALWQNWDAIVNYVKTNFPGIASVISSIADSVGAAFAAIPRVFSDAFQAGKDAINGALNWISEKVNSLLEFASPLKRLFSFGSPTPAMATSAATPAPAIAAMSGAAPASPDARMQGDVRVRIEVPEGTRANVQNLDATGGTVSAQTNTYDFTDGD